MAVKNNRFKFDSKPVRFGLAWGVLIQLILIGLIWVRPIPSVQIPTGSAPNEAAPAVHSLPAWWIQNDEAGMTDKIRHAKRIALFEPTAFKRISRIHQILHAFHSGLPVEDEEHLSELIYQESLRYGYDPELIVSVILTESSFSQGAHSRKGAIGLMQINPLTGQELAEINQTPLHSAKALYDPRLNIKLGVQYLALLHQRFGDLGVALAAYNYGPTRIAGWMDRGERLPPGYTQKILRRYKQLLHDKPPDVLSSATDPRF